MVLEAEFVGQLPRPPKDSELSQALAGVEPGTILMFTDDLLKLVGRWRPHVTEVDEPIDVRVLQTGDVRRALINELARRDQPPGRVVPAGQRLGADDW